MKPPEDENLDESSSGSDSARDDYSDPTMPFEQPSPPVAQRSEKGASGEWLNSYRLLSLIDKGGMGVVWLAEQRSPFYRKVAIKAIKTDVLDRDISKEILARFDSERQVVAMMDHPNIAKIYDAGSSQTHGPYFVMEYCRGKDLVSYCDSEHLNLEDRLCLFIQVCEAVEHAHQKGVIHRDLKPKNVIVTGSGSSHVAKVIDFGLAKAIQATLPISSLTVHTRVGVNVGTIKYMSPEQAGTDAVDVDTRSDVYSLGVMLYELLTGTTPVDTQSDRRLVDLDIGKIVREIDPPKPSQVVAARTNQESTPKSTSKGNSIRVDRNFRSSLRDELDWIVMKALEKDRHRRYQSVSALRKDLTSFLKYETIDARPPSQMYRLRKFASKNRGLVTTVLGVVASLTFSLLIVTVAWRNSIATNKELTDTQSELDQQNEKLTTAQVALDQQNKELIESKKKVDQQNEKLTTAQVVLDQQNKDLIESKKKVDQQNEKLTAAQAVLDKQNKELTETKGRLERNYEALAKSEADLSETVAKLSSEKKKQVERAKRASEEMLESGVRSWGSGDLRAAIAQVCQSLKLDPENAKAASWLYALLVDRPNFYWDIPDAIIGGYEKTRAAVVSRDGRVVAMQTSDGRLLLASTMEMINSDGRRQPKQYPLSIPNLSTIHDVYFADQKRVSFLVEVNADDDVNARIEAWRYLIESEKLEKLSAFEPNWQFFVPPFFSPDGSWFVGRGGNDSRDPLTLNYAIASTSDGQIKCQWEGIYGAEQFAISPDGEFAMGRDGKTLLTYHVGSDERVAIEQKDPDSLAVGFEVLGEFVPNGSRQYLSRTLIGTEEPLGEGQGNGTKLVLRTELEERTAKLALIDTSRGGIPYVVRSGGQKNYLKREDKRLIPTARDVPAASTSSNGIVSFASGKDDRSAANEVLMFTREGATLLASRRPGETTVVAVPQPLDGFVQASSIPQQIVRLPGSPFTELHRDRRLEFVFNKRDDKFLIPMSLSEIHVYNASTALSKRETRTETSPGGQNFHVERVGASGHVWLAEVLGFGFDRPFYHLIQVDAQGRQALQRIAVPEDMTEVNQVFIAPKARMLVTSSFRPILEPFLCVACAAGAAPVMAENADDGSVSVLDKSSPDSKAGSGDDEVLGPANDVRPEPAFQSTEKFVINKLGSGEIAAGPFEGIVCGMDSFSSRLLVRFDHGIRFFDLFKEEWNPTVIRSEAEVSAAALSLDGSVLAIGTKTGELTLYQRGEMLGNDQLVFSKVLGRKFAKQVQKVELSPDSRSVVLSVDMSLPILNAGKQLEKATKTFVVNVERDRVVFTAPATSKFYGFSPDGEHAVFAEKTNSGYQLVVTESATGEVKLGPLSPPEHEQGLFASFVSNDLLAVTSGARTQVFDVSLEIPVTPAFYHPDLQFEPDAMTWFLPQPEGFVMNDTVTLAFASSNGQRSFVVRLPILDLDQASSVDIEPAKNWAEAYAGVDLKDTRQEDRRRFFSKRSAKLRQRLPSEEWESLRQWLSQPIKASQSYRFSNISVEELDQGNAQFDQSVRYSRSSEDAPLPPAPAPAPVPDPLPDDTPAPPRGSAAEVDGI